MIYQCYECEKLYDEDDGAIVIEGELHATPFPLRNTILVFKCKKCIGDKGRKIIDRIQGEGKKK